MGDAFEHGRGGFCPLIHRNLEKGDSLYSAGDGERRIWLLQSGAVELIRGSETLGVRTPGMFVGAETARAGRYLSDAVALSKTRLCGIPAEEWEARSLDPNRDDFVWIAPALRVLLASEEGGECASS